MFFKAILIFFLIYAPIAHTREADKNSTEALILKEDLGEIYAVVFNNKWMTVRSKLEIIISDFDKNHNNASTFKKLNDLKNFVETKKLNPIKVSSFLVAFEKAENHFKQSSVKAPPFISQVSVKSQVKLTTPKPIVSIKQWPLLLFGGLSLFIFLAFVFKRKKKSIEECRFIFEQEICRESDINCWLSVKFEINHLINVSKVLLQNKVKIYQLDDLFSLEFQLHDHSLSSFSITQLKKILAEKQGELLLVTIFEGEGKVQTRKLVLNFPLNS